MSVFKCRRCGGDLAIEQGPNIARCEYCGTRQTVPTADNDEKLNLFERAGKMLRSCEFDKAYPLFETIAAKFPTEAEAYWGLVLSKFGIEYVDDPATGKKVPTCHRSGFESVMDDSDFELACDNAEGEARKLYREEAKQIEEIRRGIIEISGKEEPYDIFICYKETADDGQRTPDSVMAQDVYEKLTEADYRVFFSRITLEDKLGTEYEPYIFAALNSAKIMLVFGTDYEYFNAVWVKNEWSRFLKLMEKDKTKRLIPCYKGVDAYDMPKEFKNLQAQDMGKVGADQDLIRNIKKLLPKGEPKQAQAVVQQVVQSGPSAESFTKRAFMALEDREWEKADGFAEQALNMDPQNADAYLAKLMAEMRVEKPEMLANAGTALEMSPNYKKAMRFGDEKLVASLSRWNKETKNKNSNQILNGAVRQMNRAKTSKEYAAVADLFKKFPDNEKAVEYERICRQKAEECFREEEQRREEALAAKLIAEEQARQAREEAEKREAAAREEREIKEAKANASKKRTKAVRTFFNVIAIILIIAAVVFCFTQYSQKSSPFSTMQIIAYAVIAAGFTIMMLTKAIRPVYGIIIIAGTILLLIMLVANVRSCKNCYSFFFTSMLRLR